MPDYTLHVPSIRGATADSPDLPYGEEEFPMDDIADIDDDLLLPIAHLDQRLSLPPLRRALDELETLDDIDPETKAETVEMIHDLAECFPSDSLGDD